MYDDMKCPVCGTVGTAAPVAGTTSLMRCEFCHATDSASQFKIVSPIRKEVVSEDGTIKHFPPDNVQEAARVIEEYFAKRGEKKWAFGNLQSREDLMTLDSVKLLASAYFCMLVPQSSPERNLRAAKAAVAVVLDAPSYRTMEWDDLSEINKSRSLEIVAAVKSELGYGL
jgi:hypothetical protein